VVLGQCGPDVARRAAGRRLIGIDVGTHRPIFRADALRRYHESRDELVLPRFVAPGTFIVLWVLLGLLASVGAVAWFVAGAAFGPLAGA